VRLVVVLGTIAMLASHVFVAVAVELPGLVIKPDQIRTADPMPPGESHPLARFTVVNAWVAPVRYRLEVAQADLADAHGVKAAPASWFQVEANGTLDPTEIGIIQMSVNVPADAELGHYAALVRVFDADDPAGQHDTADLTFDVGPAPPEPGLARPVIVLAVVSLLFLLGLRFRRQLAS
jgi:hypothetical protein